jgi:type I restriction enzyme R subunit
MKINRNRFLKYLFILVIFGSIIYVHTSKVLGEDILKKIARELTELIKKNASIDWRFREAVRAKLRVMVKRLLKRYGYPPDKRQMATDLVIEQAELLSDKWAI